MSVARPLPALPASLNYPNQPDFFASADWFRCLNATTFRSASLRAYTTGRATVVCRIDNRRIHSLTNFYSQAFEVGDDLEGVASSLAADRPTSIHLSYVRESVARRLCELFSARGYYARPYHLHENWFAEVRGRDFARFMKDRPSQLTNTIKRRRKKLEAAHKVEIHLERTRGRLSDFQGIYERSWKRPEPYPDFMPELAATCERLGILRLGTLYVDGVPAASQFWITTPGKALIYKLAYDERYKEHSVGSILSSEMFREAIETDRVPEIDYGVGSEPYKRDWMEGVRRLSGLVAYNKATLAGASGAAAEALRAVASGVRNRIRRPAAASASVD